MATFGALFALITLPDCPPPAIGNSDKPNNGDLAAVLGTLAAVNNQSTNGYTLNEQYLSFWQFAQICAQFGCNEDGLNNRTWMATAAGVGAGAGRQQVGHFYVSAIKLRANASRLIRGTNINESYTVRQFMSRFANAIFTWQNTCQPQDQLPLANRWGCSDHRLAFDFADYLQWDVLRANGIAVTNPLRNSVYQTRERNFIRSDHKRLRNREDGDVYTAGRVANPFGN